MKIYIDFDGVIVNTMEIIDKRLKEANLTKTEDYYLNIKWPKLLNECEIIADAFNKIKSLSKDFDVSILTHIYTIEEGIAKINYIRKFNSDINIILVPKSIPKNQIVNAKNAILIDDYSQNINDWIKSGGIGIKFNNKKYKIINELNEFINYVKLCE